jgi:hypothetical protein
MKRTRKAASVKSKNSNVIVPPGIVSFNVGGRVFQVARGTLEHFPNTMLARMADKRWDHSKHTPSDTLYIDRNGDRFQYVLDWMRDGEVHLPVTESYVAINKELDYYGFDQSKRENIVQETIEGGRVLTAITTNFHEELDALDVKIGELEKEINVTKKSKSAIRAAYCLFMRATIGEGQDPQEVTVQDNQDKYHIAESYQHTVAMELLFARLKEYGLEVVSHKPERLYSTDAKHTFVLRRVVSRRK